MLTLELVVWLARNSTFLTTRDPNLQNVTREDRKIGSLGLVIQIRDAIIPKPGCILVAADYASMELRVLASLSGESGLEELFRNGQDLFRSVASKMFHKPVENVSDPERNQAKRTVYAVMYASTFLLTSSYGMGPHALAGQLRTSTARASEFVTACN